MDSVMRVGGGTLALVLGALALALSALVPAGSATPPNPRYRLSATLHPVGTGAATSRSGRFSGTLGFDEPLPCHGCGSAWTSLGTLEWRLTLTGVGSRAAAARIQLGPLDGGPTVGVLCRRCRAAARGTFHGHLGDHSSLQLALLRGDLELTVTVAGGGPQLAGTIEARPLGGNR